MYQDELVSIITPSYNTGKYIAETIQSVLAQTYENWELIIVDDCSNDDTDEVVQEFLQDSRIKYIKNQTNQGAALSRNYALREARGKWIAFLDSDDLWIPDKLEKQIGYMKKNNIHFSYTMYEEIDENSESLGKLISGPKRINKVLMDAYCWPGCLTILYDSEKVGLIQISDIKKNNDYAMWLKVTSRCNCYLMPEVMGKYRKRQGSISNHSYVNLIKWHYRLWRVAQNKSILISIFRTGQNLVFGLWKKIRYVKKRKYVNV